MPQIIDQIGPMLTRTRPGSHSRPQRGDGAGQAGIRQDASTKWSTMPRGIYAARHDRAATQADRRVLQDPGGQEVCRRPNPALMPDLLPAMQGWTQQISTDMMTRVREEMKKKGHDL